MTTKITWWDWVTGALVTLLLVLTALALSHKPPHKPPPPPEHYCQEKPTYCTPLTNGAGE